jgi:para-nitrobenzyl esterase
MHYVYYFDHHTAQSPQGAGHGSEVPYVFGFTAPFFGLSNPEDQAFSEKMQSYWVNFARTGDPNGPGLPHWPGFHDSDPQVLKFDTGMSAQSLPNLPQLKAIDDYFAWRRSTEPPAAGK